MMAKFPVVASLIGGIASGDGKVPCFLKWSLG